MVFLHFLTDVQVFIPNLPLHCACGNTIITKSSPELYCYFFLAESHLPMQEGEACIHYFYLFFKSRWLLFDCLFVWLMLAGQCIIVLERKVLHLITGCFHWIYLSLSEKVLNSCHKLKVSNGRMTIVPWLQIISFVYSFFSHVQSDLIFKTWLS